MKSMRQRQRGITLFVGLIMLILLTLMAIATFNIGKSSMQIVGNFQARNQALAAAQEAVEQALSTTRLLTNPTAIFLAPCTGPNTLCVDVNGDGTNDINVALFPQPTCVKAVTIKNAQLGDLSIPENLACTSGVQQGTFAVQGVPSGDSLCSSAIWEVRAVATDAVTQTNVAVTEGAAVRVPKTLVGTYCP
jgi:Tfp pilus assembly protein PilX